MSLPLEGLIFFLHHLAPDGMPSTTDFEETCLASIGRKSLLYAVDALHITCSMLAMSRTCVVAVQKYVLLRFAGCQCELHRDPQQGVPGLAAIC